MEFNNATDADVLAAYALLLASERWGAGEYRRSALGLVRAMREKLAVEVAGSVFLLPGYHGFAGGAPGSVVLNPSYMVFSAYRAFARLDDRAFWERVLRDSLGLVQRACFSPFCLPPDWVEVSPDGHLSLHASHAPRFGYEAVRTFMHLAWSGSPMPDGLARLLARHGQTGDMPGWMDLSTGEVSAEPAPAGFYAIYARAARSAGHTDAAAALEREAAAALERELSAGPSYYSFSLYLLSRFEAVP
jgi:endoglucanase